MTYRYGRNAAVRPVGLADLWHYLTDPLPAGPSSVTPVQYEWQMLGNGPDSTLTANHGQPCGDCTIAGLVHLREANAVQNGETEQFPDANTVVTQYFQMTGGADSGLNEANVLQAWYSDGLFGDRIAGYAPVDHRNTAELRSVIAAFGGSYLGVAVPQSAQEQFANGQPWDVVPNSPIEGGHAVPAIGYDNRYCYVVTWGQIQPVTWNWVSTYVEEAWAVLTSEDARVKMATLQADLERLD